MRNAKWAVLGWLLWASAVGAQSRPPLVVLDLDARGATALQAEAATRGVVRGLRDLDVFQVLSAEDVRQLLALERTRQLTGARSEGQGLANLANALGAPNAVVGTVTRVSDKLDVEIRLLDSHTSKVLAQKTLAGTTMDNLARVLPGLAQELVAPLLREQQGQLVLHVQEEATEILVDDALVATSPMLKPVDVPRGLHRVQVRKDGFIAQTREVRIEPRQVRTEQVTLLPSPDYADAYHQRHSRLRVGAVIATSVAVAALASSIIVNRLVTEPAYEQQFLPRQQWLQAQVSGSQAPPKLATGAYDAWANCPSDATGCRNTATSLQSQLNIQQIVEGCLLGLGIVSAGAATYLWVTGKDPNRYAEAVAAQPTISFDGGFRFALSGHF